MDTTASFWLPVTASTQAQDVDSLFHFLVGLSIFFFVLIVGLMIYFTIRYRRREAEALSEGPTHNTTLEVAWIVIPLVLVIIIFFWGFKGFLNLSVVPADALEIKVSGQKWFWSFTYPDGSVTANELVVPINQPIKLLMSSQDVIHSFFVPAFRVKRDVLPNRYTIMWFEATQEGAYQIYCAEYCGTSHSEMLGTVRVLPQSGYEKWLAELANVGEGIPPVEYGAKLYKTKTCYTCHSIDGVPGNGPTFLGVAGHSVKLANGQTVTADENYLRESILNPAAKVVAGYQPIMPTFQGMLKERELDALIAYIKSLSGGEGAE